MQASLKIQVPSLRYAGSQYGFRTAGKSCVQGFVFVFYQQLLNLVAQNANIVVQKEIYIQALDS